MLMSAPQAEASAHAAALMPPAAAAVAQGLGPLQVSQAAKQNTQLPSMQSLKLPSSASHIK
jgi:hypothetical protein